MSDIASDLISNIESYQQLLTTLSLGVSAGAFALLCQIIFHNSQNGSNKIFMEAASCVLAAIALHLAAILFGVCTKSALVSSVPALHAIVWGKESATKYLWGADLGHIIVFSALQIGAFLLGMGVLFYVLWRNRHLFAIR